MATNYKILIIDDDKEFHRKIRMAFRRRFEFEGAENLSKGLMKIKEWNPHLILLDLDLEGNELFEEGIQNIQTIKGVDDNTPIIVVSAIPINEGVIRNVMDTISEGAVNFLSKQEYNGEEWNKKFMKAIRPSLSNKRLAKKNQNLQKSVKRAKKTAEEIHQFITANEELMTVKQKLQRLAELDKVHLFVTGETGTGKEVVARYYHQVSKRKDQPFVEVHFAEIQESMMESMLFGHKKGSFTDATEDKTGLFEAADGGILFLDEIGKIDKKTQRLLLRFLESYKVRKLGQNSYKKLDILIVCATNKDLEKEVTEDRFLLDLYHRLKRGMEIHLPPLRERREDIVPLANYFIDEDVRQVFSKEVLQLMNNHHWEGNIRQLKSNVEKMVMVAMIQDKEQVDMDCLTDELKVSAKMQGASSSITAQDAKTKEIIRNLQLIAKGLENKEKKMDIARKIDTNWDSDNLRSLIKTYWKKNQKLVETHPIIVEKYKTICR
ncbi:MAG: sigma-54 dependent transcriptional regulator [Chitinophagales bacterium]